MKSFASLSSAHALRWVRCLRTLVPLLLALGCAHEASARLVIVGETVHRSTGAPGGEVRGAITVLNRGDQAAEVRVYQTDYQFSANGESQFGSAGSLPRSNASWLKLDTTQAAIPPGGTAEINYQGRVPTEASLRGTFWSLIMVEQTEQVAAPPQGGNARERKAAIQTVVRHAIQVVVDLGNPEPAQLKVLAKLLENDSQSKTFSVDVANQGPWMVRPEVSMELFDAQGAPAGEIEGARVRLYPTCSFRYRFDLKSVPAGRYTALVVFDTGDENVSGVQYALDVP